MRRVHACAQCCTSIIESSDLHVRNLWWKRWVDVKNWLISLDTQESEWNDLICTSVASQEWRCRIGVSLDDRVSIKYGTRD